MRGVAKIVLFTKCVDSAVCGFAESAQPTKCVSSTMCRDSIITLLTKCKGKYFGPNPLFLPPHVNGNSLISSLFFGEKNWSNVDVCS